MSNVQRLCNSARKRVERGSALLVSLMVMIGLSLLGLAFVAISESESAISMNERNHAQTVALAESGARAVVEWFQDPEDSLAQDLMPANNNDFKIERHLDTYDGSYKDEGGLLFDLPYGPYPVDMFYGEEASADIQITRATSRGRTFLNDFNVLLFGAEGGTAREQGEITEIRIYAPPIVGGNLVTEPAPGTNRFWSGGVRYGVATIMVRAEKFNRPLTDTNRRSIARAECRIVVSQFPLPVPKGPLESKTSLNATGNFQVNWGAITAQTTLTVNKDRESMPWVNAYEQIHFERGYDSSVEWTANGDYRVGDIVRPTQARITANPVLRYHEYTVIAETGAGATGDTGATEPAASGGGAWPTDPGATLVVSEVTFKQRASTAYPISTDGSAVNDNKAWLYWIARGDKSIEDPWFQARAVGTIVGAPTAQPQPTPFNHSAPNLADDTHWFQGQAYDLYPNYQQVVFPNVDYDFWKATAIAGHGNGDVFYLTLVGATGDTYTDGITSASFEDWVTREGGGYFFFDTLNRQNPQNSGPGILAPDVQVNGGGFYMSGFIYINAGFTTTGSGGGGPAGQFNQPSEPFKDIGYREVIEVTSGGMQAGNFRTDAAGQPVLYGAYNRQFDYQDLPWSNTNTAGPSGTQNDRFDVFVAGRSVVDPVTGAAYTGYFPVPYTPGCKPGNNSCAGCNCSEPHEPYLNLIYDGSVNELVVGWQDPAGTITRRAKKTTDRDDPTSTMETCAATTDTDICTSNAYDIEGGLAPLAPALDGVLYCEGDFGSSGNADYYGAVMVGPGGVNTSGTPVIWYDESLQRGTWRPEGIPRVLITSIETDR